jgi:hypothetical protein
MGKFYENLSDLIGLIKKLEKKQILAEYILHVVAKAKEKPETPIHEILKDGKDRFLK